MDAKTAGELLDKLLKRRGELQSEADALDSLILVYKRLCSREETESLGAQEQPDLYRRRSSRAFNAAQVSAIMDATRKIIIAERRPMKRGELVKRLLAQGFELPGVDKNKVFGTNLWRSGRFRSIPGEGYWPKDVVLLQS